MSKILLTGARAPVTLDIIRNLAKNGHETYCADSLFYPIAKQTKYLTQYYQVSSARDDLDQYKQDLLNIIQAHKIDYLLPTCEEVFYIAMIKQDLSPFCQVLCEDISHLKPLHSKHDVYLKMQASIDAVGDMKAPETRPLDLFDLNANSIDLSAWVLKKEYSRFGNDVIISPSLKDLKKALASSTSENRALLQQKVIGQEICCYAYAYQGKLTMLVNYIPKYRLHKSASVYFESINNDVIKNFVEHYVQAQNFTGQISFDFIQKAQDVYLIECNPRTVSGVHFCHSISFFDHLLNRQVELFMPKEKTKLQLKLAMLFFIFPSKMIHCFEWKQLYQDYSAAQDVLACKDDYANTFYQLKSLYEIICIALKKRCSLQAASTQDIEWDGE